MGRIFEQNNEFATVPASSGVPPPGLDKGEDDIDMDQDIVLGLASARGSATTTIGEGEAKVRILVQPREDVVLRVAIEHQVFCMWQGIQEYGTGQFPC